MPTTEAELSIHDRIDHIEADRVEQRGKIGRLTAALESAQSEATELRRDCRDFARLLTGIERLLQRRLDDAEAGFDPAKRTLAARAAEARIGEARGALEAVRALADGARHG